MFVNVGTDVAPFYVDKDKVLAVEKDPDVGTKSILYFGDGTVSCPYDADSVASKLNGE